MQITRFERKSNRQKRFGTKSLEVDTSKEIRVEKLPKGGRQFNSMMSTDKSEYKVETQGKLSKKELAAMRREKSKRDGKFVQGKLGTNWNPNR